MGRMRNAGISAIAAFVIIVVVIAIVAVPLVFFNYNVLNIDEHQAVKMTDGTERVDLKVTATVGNLKIDFLPLEGDAVRVVADIQGHSGFFGRSSPLRLDLEATNDSAAGGNNMSVVVGFDTYAPWPYYSLSKINYTVLIDQSLRTKLNASITTGGIDLSTTAGVVLEELRLNSTVKGATVSLNNGTVLAGNMIIKTATGGTFLYWNNLTVEGDRNVNLTESSGRIYALIDQYSPMNGNVHILAKDDVGEVHIKFEIMGEVSAGVLCKWSIGEPQVIDLGGFDGTPESFQSNNFPTLSSFNAQLNQTLGNIMVEGSWTG